MKIKICKERTDTDGYLLFIVDFVSNHVDLVVNPHYQTYDSSSVRAELRRCDVHGPYDLIDGDVWSDGLQYVTVALTDPEDLVKIRMLMDEIPHTTRYTKKDLESC